MSQSQVLFSLQQIDSQLDQAHTRIKDIDRTLASNSDLEHAQANMLAAQSSLDTQLHGLQKAEQLVQDQCIKIAQTEAALYGGKIRIPKELQDLQNEAASLKKHLRVLEDRQLEHMEAVEIAENQSNEAVAILKLTKAIWIEQSAHLHNELTNIQVLCSRLEAERAAARSPISQELLIVYENLRKQRNGVAVVKISGKSCSACGTTLSPAMLQSAQSSQTITRCPSCNRILYSG